MRPRRKAAVAVLVASLVVAILPGFAATLGGLTPRALGAGSAAVSSCDSNGFSAAYTSSSGNVTSVTLSAIADPSCEGGQLSVTLANSSGTSVASGGPQTVPTDGDTTDNSMTVALSPTPATSTVAAIHVVVTGP